MRKAFVVGHPIGHSRSPLIHGYWLKQYGLAGSYERLDVAPEDFGRFVEGLGESGFLGGNVTIPHKEAAFSGVERRTGREQNVYTSPLGVVTPGKNVARKTLLGT